MIAQYHCKHCPAVFNQPLIIDIVNHMLYKHQVLLKPSDAINNFTAHYLE